jgi:hypothetical protein
VQQKQEDERSGETWHRVERSSQVRVRAKERDDSSLDARRAEEAPAVRLSPWSHVFC